VAAAAALQQKQRTQRNAQLRACLRYMRPASEIYIMNMLQNIGHSKIDTHT
jgi:hypothetical protein